MLGFRRKPRITDTLYGNLMTSFGRTVDLDPFIAGPAAALATRVAGEEPALVSVVDRAIYDGASVYHLRLLAGAWLMAQEGGIPIATAEVFEEAIAWRFGPVARGSAKLAHRLSELARGDFERIGIEEEPAP